MFSIFGSIECIAQPISNKPVLNVSLPPVPTRNVKPYPLNYAPVSPLNYVRSWRAVAPITDEAIFEQLINGTNSYNYVKENTVYTNGLGQQVQTVYKQSSSDNSPKDLVDFNIYDEYGRNRLKYLPYVSSASDGKFKSNPFVEHQGFLQSSYPGEVFLYSETEYEASPLNRVVTEMIPGNSWVGSGKGSEIKHLFNTLNDDVKVWEIGELDESILFDGNDQNDLVPITNRSFLSKELFKEVYIDVNGNATVEYKTKEGLLILKKNQIDNSIAADYSGYSGFLCTYYIYDDLGRLRFVIQPKAVAELVKPSVNWGITATVANELCFRNEYDERGRLIAKKVPGAGWVYLLYDQKDRLVYTQDANMRVRGQWNATLYDGLDRPTVTGILEYSGTPIQLKNYLQTININSVNDQTINGALPVPTPNDLVLTTASTAGNKIATHSITMENGFESNGEFSAEITFSGADQGGAFNQTIPISGNPLPPGQTFIGLTITYYDHYSWTSQSFSAIYNNKLQAGVNLHPVQLPASSSKMTSGFITGNKVRVIEDPDDLSKGSWLTTVIFYDELGRSIQSNNTTYKGGSETTTSLYDFSGKILSTYDVHENPVSGTQVGLLLNNTYDHIANLLKTELSIYDQPQSAIPTTTVVVSELQYNSLGQLVSKKIGKKRDVNGNYTVTPIETQDYLYNIQGALKSINKDYILTNSNSRWFGYDLSYDWGFSNNQLNGNIGGVKWKSKGDGELRAFGFSYDKTSRLLGSDFSQFDGNAYSDNVNNLNFDSQMGDGQTPATAYDENGNILAMKQWGLKGLSSILIDDLTYQYHLFSGNKLLSVKESTANAGINHKLGDFTDVVGNYLYEYDFNGNLITDPAKGLADLSNPYTTQPGIIYNHLNLVASIRVDDNITRNSKGSIEYVYDAVGNKLEKRVTEFPNTYNGNISKNTVTSYIGGFVYENNTLQFFGQPEGRVRLKPVSGNTPASFVFDYMLKDHLGNVRMVLTDEQQHDIYPAATLEGVLSNTSSAISVENNYYNITPGNIVPKSTALAIPDYLNKNDIPNNNPNSDATANSEKLYRLNASIANAKMGLGITIKVMAGDEVTIHGKSYWKTAAGGVGSGGVDPLPLVDILNGFLGGVPGASDKGLTGTSLGNLPGIATTINQMLSQQVETPTIPKAYINWILFDEQFRPVISNAHTNSSFSSVGSEGILTSHKNAGGGILSTGEIIKNGYLFVYCSNESKLDVFFDNLQVTHTRGQLLEESHYYPFGLTMTGISSKALSFGGPENKKKWNAGSELQSKEFSDGSGLELYATQYRSLDPQLGRFWQLDPKPNEFLSPYVAMENNPILNSDPLGDTIINGQKYEPKDMAHATYQPEVIVTTRRMNRQPNLEIDYSSRINEDLKQLKIHPDQLKEKLFGYFRGVGGNDIDLKDIAEKLKETEYGKLVSPLLKIAMDLPKGSNADIPLPTQLNALMEAPIRYFNQQMEEGDISGIKVAHNAGYSTLSTHLESYNKRFARPEFGGGFVVLYINYVNLSNLLSNKYTTVPHLLNVTSKNIINKETRRPYPYMLYLKMNQLSNPIIDLRNIGSIFTNLK